MNGGAPLKVDDHIMSASWAPDGRTLAVVRAIEGSNQLEFPPGRVLHKAAGWLSDVSVSPHGSSLAFVHHPARHDDSGDICVTDGSALRTLSAGWGDVDGLEWNASGDEVWFTASRGGGPSTLWAAEVSSGAIRNVLQFPAPVALLHRNRQNGRILFANKTRRLEMSGLLRGDSAERSLTWLDWSRVVSISADGRMVLFDESGEAVGTRPVAYLYRRESDTTVRLGEGLAQGLTADERFAILLNATERRRLRFVPLAGGPDREIPASGLSYQWVRPLPDGKRGVSLATDSGGSLGLWVISFGGGSPPVRIASIMIRNIAVAPDGSRVAVLTPEGRLRIYQTTAENSHVDVPVQNRPPGAAAMEPHRRVALRSAP
jgi:dipeptidyl aminopeptidase/acylaminoacyl peptidase